MKKLWVRINDKDYGYSQPQNSWKLGTVVGETSLPYTNTDSLQSALYGAKMSKRYLIELEDGSVIEAWSWDTFEPVSTKREEKS